MPEKPKLHILNGDATYQVFKQTGLTGEVIIWREILSDGPVSEDDLWQTRAKWINENFGEPEENYFANFVEPLNQLKSWQNYQEINLWFEFDLVCQINLCCVLSLLSDNGVSPNLIKLICSDKIDGVANFRGLGELNPIQLSNLYADRLTITPSDLLLAKRSWSLYVENDAAKIQSLCEQDFRNLTLLKKALQIHLKRLKKDKSGLNFIEQKLVELAKISQTKAAIYQKFWATEPELGMGDAQVYIILKKLQQEGFITSLNV